jgi:hypothetical protein
MSKPTWWTTLRRSTTSAFFAFGGTGRSQAAGRMPMDNSAAIMAQGPGESSLALPVQLAHLGPGGEHVARRVDLRRFELLGWWHFAAAIGPSSDPKEKTHAPP